MMEGSRWGARGAGSRRVGVAEGSSESLVLLGCPPQNHIGADPITVRGHIISFVSR